MHFPHQITFQQKIEVYTLHSKAIFPRKAFLAAAFEPFSSSTEPWSSLKSETHIKE
jgi:hypothetical protein